MCVVRITAPPTNLPTLVVCVYVHDHVKIICLVFSHPTAKEEFTEPAKRSPHTIAGPESHNNPASVPLSLHMQPGARNTCAKQWPLQQEQRLDNCNEWQFADACVYTTHTFFSGPNLRAHGKTSTATLSTAGCHRPLILHSGNCVPDPAVCVSQAGWLRERTASFSIRLWMDLPHTHSSRACS